MRRWLWLAAGILVLCIGCAEDDGRPEPLRAPDAGRRFVEEPESEEERRAFERAERPAVPGAEVDSAEAAPPAEPGGAQDASPVDRTAAAEDEEAPPPAGIR